MLGGQAGLGLGGGRREKVVIATKLGIPMSEGQGLSLAYMQGAVSEGRVAGEYGFGGAHQSAVVPWHDEHRAPVPRGLQIIGALGEPVWKYDVCALYELDLLYR